MALDLLSIADALDEHAGKRESRIGIAIETGEDEAIIVGTSQGLLRFASALIRSAASSAEFDAQIADGMPVRWGTETRSLFEPASEIAISSECLVEAEAAVRGVLRHFQEHSPRVLPGD